MHLDKIITGICTILFLMVGADKFLGFMEPPCSMEGHIPPLIWKTMGVLMIISAFLLWLPKYRKHLAGFWAVYMIVFVLVHLTQSTYDVAGAISMAVLLGVLVWNPSFIGGKATPA